MGWERKEGDTRARVGINQRSLSIIIFPGTRWIDRHRIVTVCQGGIVVVDGLIHGGRVPHGRLDRGLGLGLRIWFRRAWCRSRCLPVAVGLGVVYGSAIGTRLILALPQETVAARADANMHACSKGEIAP